MTPEQFKQAIHDILDDHDAAINAIREANQAMQRVNSSLQQANAAMADAIRQHDDAIVSAITANRRALKLLNDWPE